MKKEKRRMLEAQVGDELQPLEYIVTTEIVEKHLESLGMPHRHRPHGSNIAPSTIVDNDSVKMKLETFIIDHGGLHAKQEFEFINPIVIGKKIKTTGKVVDRYLKKGRDYIVVETVTTDEDGTELLRARNYSCYSERDKTKGGEGKQ